MVFIKCHKCRQNVLVDTTNESLTNAHGNLQLDDVLCESLTEKKMVFLREDNLPDWIASKVEEEQWTKGKLHCQNCGCKIGSFDFVSGRKCSCGNHVIPPVHLITSQVDVKASGNS